MKNKIGIFFTTGFSDDRPEDIKWYDHIFDIFFSFGPTKISSKIPFFFKFIFNVVIGCIIVGGIIFLALYIYWKFFI